MRIKGPDCLLVKNDVPNHSVKVGFVDNFGEQDLDLKLNGASYSRYPNLGPRSHLFKQLICESYLNPPSSQFQGPQACLYTLAQLENRERIESLFSPSRLRDFAQANLPHGVYHKEKTQDHELSIPMRKHRNNTMCKLWATFNTVTPPTSKCGSVKVKPLPVNFTIHPHPLQGRANRQLEE